MMKYLVGLLVVAMTAVAGPIVTSSTRCTARDYDTGQIRIATTGATACTVPGHITRAEASGWLAAEGHAVQGAADAIAIGTIYFEGEYGTAAAAFSIRDTFSTAGARREGKVRYWLELYYSGSAQVPFRGYEPMFSVLPIYGEEAIALGRNMPVALSAIASADGTVSAYGWASVARLRMEFYESDGTTPVNVFSVPEPSNWFMAGIGVSCVLARPRRTMGARVRW